MPGGKKDSFEGLNPKNPSNYSPTLPVTGNIIPVI